MDDNTFTCRRAFEFEAGQSVLNEENVSDNINAKSQTNFLQHDIVACAQQSIGFEDDATGSTDQVNCGCVLLDDKVHLVNWQDGELETHCIPSRGTVCAWNSSGTCTVVGDVDGALHFISKQSGLMFSQKVLGGRGSGQFFESISFLESPRFFDNEDVGDDLFAVSSNPPRMFRFSNLCLGSLADATESGNVALLKTVRESTVIESFNLAGPVSTIFPQRNQRTGHLQVILGGKSSCQLSVWVSQDSRSPLTLDCVGLDPLDANQEGGIIKLVPLSGGNAVLSLSKTGRMCVWDAKKLIFLCAVKTDGFARKVRDIIATGLRVGCLLEDGSFLIAKLFLNGKLTVLYKYDSPLGSKSVLVGMPGSCGGSNIYCLLHNPDKNTIVGLDFCETNQEMRLEQLLLAKRFDEAILLGEETGAMETLALAYKGRVAVKLDEARAILIKEETTPKRLPDQLMDDVRKNLKRLAAIDFQFVFEGCMKVRLPGDFDDQLFLLQFALTLCKEYGNEKVQSEIEEALYRIETYSMLHSSESKGFDCDRWQKFRTCRPRDALILALKAGRVHAATVLWQRHVVKDKDVSPTEMLKYLPLESTAISVVLTWIQDQIAPFVGGSNREKLKLVKWVLTSALRVAATSPSDALLLVDQVAAISCSARLLSSIQPEGDAAVVSDVSSSERIKLTFASPLECIHMHGRRQEVSEDDSIAELLSLRQDLIEILFLKSEQNITLSLEQFKRIGREGVMMLLLDKVMAPELIQEQIQVNVLSLATRYRMNVNQTLLHYIDKIAAEINGANSGKEQCAVQVVRCIEDLSFASRAVLSLMRSIMPPYSDELQQLVSESARWSTEHQEEIVEQKRLMDLRALVNRFRVQRLNFASANHAKSLVMYVLAKAHDNMNVIEDALEIAGSYRYINLQDVFATVLQNTILDCTGNWQECREKVKKLLLRIPGDIVEEVYSSVRHFCILTLNDEFETPSTRLKAAAVGAVVCFASGEEVEAEHFTWIRLAQEELEVALSLDDIGSSEAFGKYVIGKRDEVDMPHMLRLAQLLGFPDQGFVFSQLACVCAKSKQFEKCIYWASKLGKCCAPWKHHIAVALSATLSGNSEIYENILELLLDSLHTCNDVLLSEGLELMRSVSIVLKVIDRCDDSCEDALWNDHGSYSSSSSPNHGDDGDGAFDGNCSILTSSAILPILAKMLFHLHSVRYRYRTANRGDEPVTIDFETFVEPVVNYLRQNNALQLSLSVLTLIDVQLVTPNHKAKLESCLLELAEKVFQAPTIDKELAVGYLLAVADDHTATSCFRASIPRVNSDFKRLEVMSQIGMIAGRSRMIDSLYTDCRTLCKHTGWWCILNELGVEFEHANFTERGPSTKRDLYLKKIVADMTPASDFDLTMLLNFAECYELDRNVVYALFFKGLFLSDKGLDKYLTRLSTVVKDMPNDLLEHGCEYIFPRLDGTDYEKIGHICTYLETLGATKSHSAARIQRYTQVLDLLGASAITDITKRLNFHGLFGNQPWVPIETQISPGTIKWLVALGDPLDLDPDDFYLCLVHKLLASDTPLSIEKTILPYIEQVQDDEKSIKTCTKLALKLDDNPVAKLVVLRYALKRTKDQRMAKKIKEKINDTATLVDVRNFVSEAQVQLDYSDPKLLLSQLYQRFASTSVTRRDDHENVHAFADRIGSRYGIDMHMFRKQLALGWLKKTCDISSITGSNANHAFQTTESEIRQNFEMLMEQRIAHILTAPSEDVPEQQVAKFSTAFLLNYVFRSDAPNQTFRSRARALGSMFRIATLAEINSVYEQSSQSKDISIQEYWQYCIYMVEFEEMRLPHTVEQLINCDKAGLIRALWRDFRDRPRAVHLVVNIVLDFEIFDMKIIEAILRQMCHMGMFRCLFSVVTTLLMKPEIQVRLTSSDHQVTQIIKDATTTVFQQFSTHHPPASSARPMFDLIRSVLIKLPGFESGDFRQMVAEFAKLGEEYCHCAVRCAVAIQDMKSRCDAVVFLIERFDMTIPIIGELTDIGERGLLETAFTAIDDSKKHRELYGTKYLKIFVDFLVKSDKLSNILELCMKKGQTKQALELANRWATRHGKEITETEILQACLSNFSVNV